MARVPSDRMISEPLQTSFDCCRPEVCEVKQAFLADPSLKAEARLKCSQCRKIYKFDKELHNDSQVSQRTRDLEAEIKLLKEIIENQQVKIKQKKFKPYRGGKGETYFKRYSETVANLRAAGKTQKQISEILGISIFSVNKICKKL